MPKCPNNCGQCCINNGLIPPLMPDEEAPEWLRTAHGWLCSELAHVAETMPCLYLTDDMRCSIYEHRPAICREFLCDPVKETE